MTIKAIKRIAPPAAVLLAAALIPALNASAGPTGRVAIADARPAWATAAADRGHADPHTRLNARVYLAGRDPRGLTAFIASVSDPKSAAYQKFLSPAQYNARFGPTRAQADAISSWLTSTGMTVTGTNAHYISVRGDLAQAERAFGTTIDDYADTTANGAAHYAPAGRVTVPATVSSAILGVTGLDNGEHRTRPAGAAARATTQQRQGPDDTLPGPTPVVLRAGPCSSYFGQKIAKDEPATYGHKGPWTTCGYTPQQIRSAYGLTFGPTGAGQTIAIVDAYASPTIVSDARTFARRHQPSYQANVVPKRLSTTLPTGKPLAKPMRVVPDVAADADNNTGILVGQTQHFKDGTDRYHETRWGGTSLSAPLFAGIQALAQQVTRRPFGFANPAIYALHGTRAFDDVTDTPRGPGVLLGVVRDDYTDTSDPASALITRVQTFGHDGLLHATPGFDNVTGVGSPSNTYTTSYARRP